RSCSSWLSRLVLPRDSSMPAITTPMMTTTTSSSTSVKPAVAAIAVRLLVEVPVADIGVIAFAAQAAIGAEGVQVVLAAMRARQVVLVVVAPRILVDVLQVAARPPV